MMQMRARMESLVEEMLDGHIMLDEAIAELERMYIERAMRRHKDRLSRTAASIGIHRNTLSKRIAQYRHSQPSISHKAQSAGESANRGRNRS